MQLSVAELSEPPHMRLRYPSTPGKNAAFVAALDKAASVALIGGTFTSKNERSGEEELVLLFAAVVVVVVAFDVVFFSFGR